MSETALEAATEAVAEAMCRKLHPTLPMVRERMEQIAVAVLERLGIDPDAPAGLVVVSRDDLAIINEQRLYAERCIGSLPLGMGEHFERRRQEVNSLYRRIIEEATDD